MQKKPPNSKIRVNLPLETLTDCWDKRPAPEMDLDTTIEYFFLRGVKREHPEFASHKRLNPH
jgi:hypothetical protein